MFSYVQVREKERGDGKSLKELSWDRMAIILELKKQLHYPGIENDIGRIRRKKQYVQVEPLKLKKRRGK